MKSLQNHIQENQINEDVNSSAYSLAIQKALAKIISKEIEKIKIKTLDIFKKSSKAISFYKIEDVENNPFIKCIIFQSPSSGKKIELKRIYINFTLETIQYSDSAPRWSDSKWRNVEPNLSNLEELLKTTN